MFTLTIETSGSAFDDDPAVEVARLLQNVAARLEYDTWAGVIFDVNGNDVGTFTLDNEE